MQFFLCNIVCLKGFTAYQGGNTASIGLDKKLNKQNKNALSALLYRRFVCNNI